LKEYGALEILQRKPWVHLDSGCRRVPRVVPS